MTARTSSRSAKATLRMAEEPDTNGTPTDETESESATTSGSTTWILTMQSGQILKLDAPGNGRVTLGGPASGHRTEARFYPTKTAKDYVASIANVVSVWRGDVQLEELVAPPARSAKASYEPEGYGAEITGDALTELARRIVDGYHEGTDEVEIPF